MRLRAAAFTAGLLLLASRGTAAVPGFTHASGTSLVDGSGAPVLLKGVNLGGWLQWESYLVRFDGEDLTESRMKRRLVEVAGRDAAFAFMRQWRDRWITVDDIRRIKALGWNVVRVPVNSRILAADPHFDMAPGEGWPILDRLLGWCEAGGVKVVLDLHSAPGGQNPGGISDNEQRAGLWTGDSTTRFRDATVALWKRIARRYRNRTVVAAYDLLNEPVVPDEAGGGRALSAFLGRLVAAVRSEDRNHLIMAEGNWYATDFSGFRAEDGWTRDGNLCFHFHKYWNETGTRSIRYLLDLRRDRGIPLWLGETGENSPAWYARCRELVEGEGIGWCFWPWKRVGGGCVEEIVPGDAWPVLSRALGDPAIRLSRTEIAAGLSALADAMPLARCREDAATVRALTGTWQPVVRLPGRLWAAEYATAVSHHRGNRPGAFRGGDVDIADLGAKRFEVCGMDPGDALTFAGESLVRDRVRPVLLGATGLLEVAVDGATLATAGVQLPAGPHSVTVTARSAGAGFDAVELAGSPGRVEAEDFRPGKGTGYGDSATENRGKAYRMNETVGVAPNEQGGYEVGWIEEGDWLTWNLDVARAGSYDVLIRCASPDGGGPFRLSMDGAPLGGPQRAPKTGWWTVYEDVRIKDVRLPAGRHVLRLDADGAGFNLDYFLFLPRGTERGG